MRDGLFVIRPPQDKSLTMLVLEHTEAIGKTRGPASADSEQRKIPKRIEVIVSAP
jgi:hypothetical protein